MKFSGGNSRITQLLLSSAEREAKAVRVIKFFTTALTPGSHLQGLSLVGSTW